jgi:hypothetical protein
MRIVRNVAAASAVLLGLSSVGAQAATIATWNFETSQPVTAGPLAAEIGTGTALGHHASAAAVYSTPAGNGSAHSFSANNWSVGDYYQFSVSTLGDTDVSFSWDQTSSSTGPKDFTLSYSTDGTHFTAVDNGTLTNGSYSVKVNGSSNPTVAAWNGTTSSSAYSFTEDLSSVAALDNQSNVVFRLTDADTVAVVGSNPVAATGTDRVDNVTVAASPVPLPAAAWLFGSGFAMLAGLRRKRISA